MPCIDLSPHGGSADDTFILQQGSHTGISAQSETHTQDFVYTQVFNFLVNAGQLNSSQLYAFTLRDLGVRISHVSIWQTYKLNSITLEWFLAGSDPSFAGNEGQSVEQLGDFVLSIAPYSRDPRTSTSTVQSLDPQSIPGCQVKYFNSWLYYPRIFGDGTGLPNDSPPIERVINEGIVASASYFQTQPQMLKVTNENPMYSVQPLSTTNTLSGEVYSNHPLALLSAAGRDQTQWHCFFARVDTFDPVPLRNVVLRGNIIVKFNVTFEGIRWDPPALYLNPSESFRDDVSPQPGDEPR